MFEKAEDIAQSESTKLRDYVRLAGGDPKTFLKSANFDGIDLRNQDLRGFDLSEAQFKGVVADRSTLVEPSYEMPLARQAIEGLKALLVSALSSKDRVKALEIAVEIAILMTDRLGQGEEAATILDSVRGATREMVTPAGSDRLFPWRTTELLELRDEGFTEALEAWWTFFSDTPTFDELLSDFYQIARAHPVKFEALRQFLLDKVPMMEAVRFLKLGQLGWDARLLRQWLDAQDGRGPPAAQSVRSRFLAAAHLSDLRLTFDEEQSLSDDSDLTRSGLLHPSLVINLLRPYRDWVHGGELANLIWPLQAMESWLHRGPPREDAQTVLALVDELFRGTDLGQALNHSVSEVKRLLEAYAAPRKSRYKSSHVDTP